MQWGSKYRRSSECSGGVGAEEVVSAAGGANAEAGASAEGDVGS
ncbi:hypothetical protein [Paenibacillus oryzisoli]|nr:hypothetical protein [Paenibacillus oryzisoli]